MRISYWSSDVCSSDLFRPVSGGEAEHRRLHRRRLATAVAVPIDRRLGRVHLDDRAVPDVSGRGSHRPRRAVPTRADRSHHGATVRRPAVKGEPAGTQPEALAQQSSRRVLRSVVLGGVLLAASFMGLQVADLQAASGDRLGSQDFAAYWSAYEVTVEGGNPYAEAELERSQEPLGLTALDEAQRFWNPPWEIGRA